MHGGRSISQTAGRPKTAVSGSCTLSRRPGNLHMQVSLRRIGDAGDDIRRNRYASASTWAVVWAEAQEVAVDVVSRTWSSRTDGCNGTWLRSNGCGDGIEGPNV